MVITGDGPVRVEIPRDLNGSFEPLLIPKHERRLTRIDDKIIAMYARGMTMRAIRDSRTSQFGVAVPVGPGKVLLSAAGTRKRETPLTDFRPTTWSVGYDYDRSRRIAPYAVVMSDSVTGLQGCTSFAFGVRHRV